MKRITTNDDIRFPIRVVKGLDSDIFTIQFYTTSKAVCLTKTNADVVDGIIHLEWTELYPLGTGVMNYTVLIPEADGSYSDDTFNKSISGTTIFYIVSDIIVPDGDEAQELVEVVADLQTQVNALEAMFAVTINSSNWNAVALKSPNTRYIINGNLDFNSATEVQVGDNCQIEFTKGSTLGSNVELLINNAEIVAPLTQIFDGTKITGFFHNGQIPVEWFGAKGDGETDDAEAINTTIKYAGKSEVLLSAPIYVIGSTIDINETNANFDSYEGQIEAAREEEGGKKFLCKGSIYSTSDFTGYTVGNVTVPAMVRLAASNATVRIEGAIVVHADLTDCIGFLHEGYHDNKVYIARVMKARDYVGVWSWLDGTNIYTNQALMNLGTCDGVVYIYTMGGDFECEQICGFNNGFMVSDKYATAYAGVQQASFKFASITANYAFKVQTANQDGVFVHNTKGWMNACRIEYNGISGDNESRRFIPTTDATLIKVDCGSIGTHFCQNRFICNSVEPIWYKLMDINNGRGNYFEFLGNFGDCHVIPYNNGVPDDRNQGGAAPTICYNGEAPYTSTNKYINISNVKDFLINNLTPFYAMPYDTIYVHGSNNVVFTNCQSAEYLKDNWYQYDEDYRRFEKVIFTSTDVTDPANGTDITVFEPDSRETDTIAYVESANDIDLTVDRLNIVTTPAYTTKFNVYPLYQVIDGVKSQLGYCYDYEGLIASNNALEEALSHVTVDAYTKAETDALLSGKANKNGSANESFTTHGLNLQREGAATTLYNYIDGNNKEFISFYDRTGGSLTYQFTPNQADNIATERQLALKANSADVYSKTETNTLLAGKAGYKHYNSKSDMEADTNVPTGTIGYDSDEEKFYIYDYANDEWKPIDQTGGSGDGKQREIIYYSNNTESYYSTPEDRGDEINPLTYDDIKTLISDKTKEVVIDYFSALYYLFNSYFENDPFYAEVSFRSIQYPSIGDLFIEMWDGKGDDPSTMNTYLNSFQIPSSFFGICTQSGAARTVTIGDWKGRQGDLIVVKFTQDVPAGMTLNVSDTSLRNIYYRDSLITGDLIKANDKVTLLFYNNSFHVIGIDSSLSGGGDQSDGKQREVLLLGQNDNDEYIVLDQDHNELSGEEVFSLITDQTKEVVIFETDNNFRYYSEYYFYDEELEDNYAEVNFICIVGNTYQRLFLELYYDEGTKELAYHIDVDSDVPISNISTSMAIGWTGGNSNNYTATANSFRFVTGSIITVRFSMANIYGATLNVSNTGNKNLYYHGSRIPAGTIQAGDLVTLMVSGGGYNVMSIYRKNCNDKVAATNTINTTAQQITFNISDYGYYYPTPSTSGNYSNYSIIFNYTAPTGTTWATNPIHTIWCEGTYFQGRQVTFPNTWVWENNDDPTVGNFSHLGDDIEAIEITVRKGKYASYKKW